MKVQTRKLAGAALDWAVASCNGDEPLKAGGTGLRYSTDWDCGGPLLDKYIDGLSVTETPTGGKLYHATRIYGGCVSMPGETKLVAVCRCYVASVMGYEVDVPEELV